MNIPLIMGIWPVVVLIVFFLPRIQSIRPWNRRDQGRIEGEIREGLLDSFISNLKYRDVEKNTPPPPDVCC